MNAFRWFSLSVAIACSQTAFAEWQPKTAPLMTRWAKDVTPDKVHPEYPRPHLVREHWLNLNGLWDYAIVQKDVEKPTTWDGQILVPFPVESALSGVMRRVGPDQRLWYRRSFTVPNTEAWKDKRILVHFGAIDWQSTVHVNQQPIASHRGGFTPQTLDITDLIVRGENQLMVEVWDPSDAGYQPRGKQVQNPHGIWYTPVTGIWQTVWLEPVPKTYLRSVRISYDLDKNQLLVNTELGGNAASGLRMSLNLDHSTDAQRRHLTLDVPLDGKPFVFPNAPSDPAKTIIPAEELWSPSNPVIWNVQARVESNRGDLIDQVNSYTAFRKISLGKDVQGVMRMMLNNKPLFQYGTLDQGWWPDGLYTAPTDEALKFDIGITKQYGFNMIRKHVKVEPARWYYWCDMLGMLVWQDMPSGDKSAEWDPFGKFNGQEITRSEESAMNYRREWRQIMNFGMQFPCIVVWVPFNEAWGQFDTVAVTNWTKEYDPTRLVNCASGGNDFPVGDIVDYHRYPGPFAPRTEEHRAAVLGEYGGLGLPLKGRTWQDEKNWGYRSFTSQEALTEAYLDLIDKLHPLIDNNGLSAAIYTQTTDVEIEVNGLLTYDRAIEKLPVKALAEAHKRLWQPAPKVSTLIPTAESGEPPQWSYTTEKPAEDWFQPDFDAASWKTGPAGFGEPSTPGTNVKTHWKTPDIWLRRTFDLKESPAGELRLRIHHDEDAEIYLNGVLIKRVTGYINSYSTLSLSAESRKALTVGQNVLAVHCHQTGGGQYIDAGFDVWTAP